jgi:hypothetical protein
VVVCILQVRCGGSSVSLLLLGCEALFHGPSTGCRCAVWTVAVDGPLLVMMKKRLTSVEQKLELELEQWDGGLACHWFTTRDGAGYWWGLTDD